MDLSVLNLQTLQVPYNIYSIPLMFSNINLTFFLKDYFLSIMDSSKEKNLSELQEHISNYQS